MQRLPWVDAVRGICIFLIVLGHSIGFYPLIAGQSVKFECPFWIDVTAAFAPIRLATFFLISGYLSRRVMTKSWRQVNSSKLAPLLYVFVVWTCLLVIIFHTLLIYPQIQPDYTYTAFLHPMNHLWYLWALALFVIIAKATRRLPRSFILVVAGIISFFSSEISLPSGVTANFLFFLLGVYSTGQLTVIASKAKYLWIAALVVIYGAGAVLGIFGHSSRAVSMIMSLTGVVLLTQIASIWSRTPTLPVRALFALGKQTLAIYVMHIPLLVFIAWFTGIVFPLNAMSPLIQIFYPVIATSLVMILAIGSKYLLDRMRITRFLLELPISARICLAGRARP